MFYSQDTDALNTNGLAYHKAIRQLSTGVYLAEVCLIGLFAIATSGQTAAAGPLALMVVFLVITALYQTFLDHTVRTLEKNIGNEAEPVSSKEGEAPAPAMGAITQKPVNFLVKLLHPPAVPVFDAWLSNPLPPYSEEDRREAYLNPAIWQPTPILWIVRDEMGISTKEKEATSKVIEVSDAGAWFDEKGKVQTILSQSDEKGEVNKAIETPIWKEPIVY